MMSKRTSPKPLPELTPQQIERFWLHVDKTHDCWEWTGKIRTDGYGCVSINYGEFATHRIAYLIQHGDPGELCVLHTCDNRKCVRHDHLFSGTHQENVQDAVRKGRNWKPKGETSGRAVLTEDDVRSIRKSSKIQVDLAAEYGVSRSCIQHVVQRLNWKHVK